MKKIFSCFGLASLAACVAPPTKADSPAVLAAAGATTRAVLEKNISEMLGMPVTLADDAFAASDTLLIERNRPRDASGRQLMGRDLGVPEVIKLVKNSDQCVLVHEVSRKRKELKTIDCEALNK